jgi:branched-chain amino acid transport system substrate-binding protein
MSETRKLLEAQLETSVNETDDLNKLEDLYREHQDAPLADVLLYFSGRKAYRLGFSGIADSMIRTLVARHSRSNYYSEAQDILRTIQNQTKVDSRAIGLLMPMSGRFAKFAEHTLNAVELAFGVYGSERPNPDITIIVADSGPEGEDAVKGLERLYFDHNVVAVIGPLTSKKIPEVTQRAQELGVPMISLAQKPGMTGNFVFQIAVTARNQAKEIARHAIQKEGLKRFAVAYPQDPFGKEYSDAFWDAVEELGGSVVGVEGYDPAETDYRMIVDKLSGLHYLDARGTETRILGQLRDQLGITKRYWKTEPFYRLKPIVDYDAVFVPDSAKNVSQLLPTFAYRDVEGIRYLGISTWNSPRLLKNAKDYSSGSVFVDVFNSKSSAPEVQRFAEAFQGVFGYAPTAIEATAYDAGSLVRKALQVSGTGVSRGDLRDLMTGFKNFPGVTGRISYDEGTFTRELKFFRISSGRIEEIKG